MNRKHASLVSHLRAEAMVRLDPLVERSVLRVRREVPLEHEAHGVPLQPEQRLHPKKHVPQLQPPDHQLALSTRAHAAISRVWSRGLASWLGSG